MPTVREIIEDIEAGGIKDKVHLYLDDDEKDEDAPPTKLYFNVPHSNDEKKLKELAKKYHLEIKDNAILFGKNKDPDELKKFLSEVNDYQSVMLYREHGYQKNAAKKRQNTSEYKELDKMITPIKGIKDMKNRVYIDASEEPITVTFSSTSPGRLKMLKDLGEKHNITFTTKGEAHLSVDMEETDINDLQKFVKILDNRQKMLQKFKSQFPSDKFEFKSSKSDAEDIVFGIKDESWAKAVENLFNVEAKKQGSEYIITLSVDDLTEYNSIPNFDLNKALANAHDKVKSTMKQEQKNEKAHDKATKAAEKEVEKATKAAEKKVAADQKTTEKQLAELRKKEAKLATKEGRTPRKITVDDLPRGSQAKLSTLQPDPPTRTQRWNARNGNLSDSSFLHTKNFNAIQKVLTATNDDIKIEMKSNSAARDDGRMATVKIDDEDKISIHRDKIQTRDSDKDTFELMIKAFQATYPNHERKPQITTTPDCVKKWVSVLKDAGYENPEKLVSTGVKVEAPKVETPKKGSGKGKAMADAAEGAVRVLDIAGRLLR